MAQTLTQIYLHLIFSTKNRVDLIPPDIEQELFAYFGGIIRNHDSKLIATGGTANHVHLLISMSKNIKIPGLMGSIKRESSEWIKTKGASKFAWQDGYGAFSAGYTQIEDVKRYIKNQKEHHSKRTFEAEFVNFLQKYGLEYDEKYLWS